MTPYADFTYFGLLLLYLAIPTIVLGWFGRANARWALIATVLAMFVHFDGELPITRHFQVPEIAVAIVFVAWQGALTAALLRCKSRPLFYVTLALSILPLVVAKWLPFFAPQSELGFLGISYVTFRALDVLFSIHDGVLKKVAPLQYCGFLLFFPTISSGPIDRYRRFSQDWEKKRTREEFLADLDVAVQRVFRGFFYKFLLAALVKTYWMDRVAQGAEVHRVLGYMYAYALYLFFDFAGYSAFAVGISRLFGVRTPENFHLPFLARNIRDFWNRWHISLSFWFRDHVYMRFLLAAAKGKWFKGKHTSSYLGLFLTFGLMGVWHMTHRVELNYLIYGFYHAALLAGYDWFARWNKQRKLWPDTPAWRVANTIITIHAVCFGLLIFSGRLNPSHAKEQPAPAPAAEKADAH